MKTRSIALLASAALIASISQASAEIVDVTYTGKVAGLNDPNQLIGSNLAVGQSFVATYVFDTSLGDVFSSSNENYAFGGGGTSAPGLANPLLSASVTIGGSSITLPTLTGGGIQAINVSSGSNQYAAAIRFVPNAINDIFTASIIHSGGGGTIPASITTPFTYTVGVGDIGTGQIVLESSNGFGYWYDNAVLDASLTSETLAVPAIPEPPTWTMMLVGLVGFGFIAFRRRKPSMSFAAA